MSGDQVKAYVYLLCESWLQDNRATLPDDEKELASMARVSTEKWCEIKDKLLECFKPGKCADHKGRLYNEKLLEISKLNEIKRLNRENKTGTKSKQNKNKPRTARAIANAIAIDTNFTKAYLYRAFSGGGYKVFRGNLSKAVELIENIQATSRSMESVESKVENFLASKLGQK